MIVTAGALNKSVYFYVQEDAGNTNPGEPATGIAFGSLTSASYNRTQAARVAVTPATQTPAGAHSDGGWIEVDATNQPGTYRFDPPDLAFATGADQVIVQVVPGAGFVCAPVVVDLTDMDLREADGTQFTEAGGTGDQLTAINLPNQTMDIVGDITGNLSGSVGSLTGHTNQTADHTAGIADIPTVAEFNARTILAANYALEATVAALNDPTVAAIVLGVWDELTATARTAGSYGQLHKDNLDAAVSLTALATALVTAQNDLDVITDADGVILGAAAVDLVWDEVLTGGTHNVANSSGRRLRALQEFQGYEGGAVWVDTVNGTAGTTNFENGTVELPVLTLADALTIVAAVNLKIFQVTRDSTIAPAADFNDFTVYGTGYTFTLGGFDYAGTHIFHASPLTGVATSGNNSDHFDVLDSIVGNVTVDDAHFTNCGFTGTVTLSGVGTATPGELRLVDCFSLISTASTPVLDFGTGSEDHNVIISNWQNGLEIQNFNVVTTGGTDLLTISGRGELIINANCDGGTINLRGQWEITDNSGGAVTITQDDLATDIQTRLPAALVGSRMDSSIGAMAAAVQTAASFAASAIDAAALATDAVNEIRDSIIPTQNAAHTFKYVWVAASDHVTPVTGASTITVTRSIDGGAFAAAGGTHTEIANGVYRFAATAGDMNGAEIAFRFVATGGTPGAPDDAFVFITTTGGV